MTVKQTEPLNSKAELNNFITTIVDNYRLEIDYFKKLYALLDDLISHQAMTSSKLDSVLKTFETFNGIDRPVS